MSTGSISVSRNGLATTTSIALPKKPIGTGATTPIYSNTHGQLTNGNKMNQSPFVANGTARTIGTGATTPLTTNTHGQLTNSKTMNESPFKTKARQ